MYRYCIACMVLASLGGCAANLPGPEPPVSAIGVAATAAQPSAFVGQVQALAAPVPAASVDIKDFEGKTICESITAPGSRMVVEKRCYTPSKNDKEAAARAENTRAQIANMRREQEMREQMQRQVEMDRQRAAMRP
jgi:hypothetical protein